MICKSCKNPILKSEHYFRPPKGGFRHDDCAPAKMRQRMLADSLGGEMGNIIEDLQRSIHAECNKRISELEAALREIIKLSGTLELSLAVAYCSEIARKALEGNSGKP